jgi:hypothetical protein
MLPVVVEGRPMSSPQADERPSDRDRIIQRGLAKVTRALVGNDERQRERALATLASAHPGVARPLAERLVARVQRGGAETRARALVALVAIGRFAVPDVALAAVTNRRADVQLAAVEVLCAIGQRLKEREREPVVAALIDLLRANREKQVRDAALSALMALPLPGT